MFYFNIICLYRRAIAYYNAQKQFIDCSFVCVANMGRLRDQLSSKYQENDHVYSILVYNDTYH